MKPRIFLDTNLFIYAHEFPNSNSNRIIQLLNNKQIEGVISEQILKEIQLYFKRHYDKDLAGKFRYYLLQSCAVIPRSQVQKEMKRWEDQIKEKDLEQLAVVKKLGIKFLVSYDRDFASFKEYLTPKEFVKRMDLEPNQAEF